jgi:hypothetical protein
MASVRLRLPACPRLRHFAAYRIVADAHCPAAGPPHEAPCRSDIRTNGAVTPQKFVITICAGCKTGSRHFCD